MYALPKSPSAVPHRFHDPDYQRPIRRRYVDPIEVIWLATATRLDHHVRRDPGIFSSTDGSGLIAFSTRPELDEDDCLAQMLFHELCHWVTNGHDSRFHRDWGFPLCDEVDINEHACIRLQAWWAGGSGLRDFFGPTSTFRQYYEMVPEDPLEPLDDSPWERAVVALAAEAIERAQGEPWAGPMGAALEATRQARALLEPFVEDYRSEQEGDPLPLLWAPR